MGNDLSLQVLAGWFARDGGAPARKDAGGGTAAAGEDLAVQASGPSGWPPAGSPGTFIGPGVRLVGTLACRHDLAIQGHVQGPIAGEGHVVVERGGLVEGDVRAPVIRVRGRTRGTLVATAGIILEDGCEHRGSLHGPQLVVEAGAVLEGEVKVGSRGGPAQEDMR